MNRFTNIIKCNKITLQYCNWGGSSKGIKEFIKSKKFIDFAKHNQNIQIHLVQKTGHPVIKGYYNNGKTKAICVKNLNLDVVNNKLEILRTSSGEPLSKYKQAVHSLNESARGIWSPMHVDPSQRHKI